MTVYIVVELPEGRTPSIIGVYDNEDSAKAKAYGEVGEGWRNIIEREVEK